MIPVDEIERIVAAALAGDRQAETRMLVALRPGVALAVTTVDHAGNRSAPAVVRVSCS